MVEIQCQGAPIRARYINIKKVGQNTILDLNEVKIKANRQLGKYTLSDAKKSIQNNMFI